MNKDTLQLAADTIRILSAEAVEKANSGHPGMPMGMAELGAVLWTKFLKFNPQDPAWLGRDRFVLSNGHGSMLLYSLLHLSGFEVSIEDLKNFRQLDSITPGHPENFVTPGVETTTGPLGQGIANAVGMAIGQKLMSAKYGNGIFDHKVWCFCGDGCLMEGVSSEASSIAGHLGLSNLVLVYDDNHISIAGETELAFTENVRTRYQAYGWRILEVDGHNIAQIEAAYKDALIDQQKPVLICARTSIGKGSPKKQGTEAAHGSPLGKEELLATKKAIAWPSEQEFFVPDAVASLFASRVEELKADYQLWQNSYASLVSKNSELVTKLKQQLSTSAPENLWQKIFEVMPKEAVSTRKLSEIALQVVSKEVESLIGGSADLEPSTLTLIKGSSDVQKGEFSGKNLRFGVREHAMGSIMNGLSYYGGFVPYGSTFLCFLDYMRPAVRLAALTHLKGLFIYTHDSIFLGEDGPTHQPIEHLAMLRMTPNINTYRPADALETAVCYQSALDRQDGPSALIFSRQNLTPIPRKESFQASEILKGAYAALEKGKPDLVIVATGSEVSLALEVAANLDNVRVVSMPCVELFLAQPDSVKENLIPSAAKKVVIEAAIGFGWFDIVGGTKKDTLLVTMQSFGASAPQSALAKKFGFTKDQVLEKIKNFH